MDVQIGGRRATTMAGGRNVSWLLESRAQLRASHPFVVWEPREGERAVHSFAAFSAQVEALAAGLRRRGIRQGDTVVLHMENCPEFLFAWFALTRIGAVAVCTNTRSSIDELRHYGEHSGSVAALTQPKFAGAMAEALPGLRWLALTDTDAGDVVDPAQRPAGDDRFDALFVEADTPGADGRPADVDPFAPAWIQYTSGTTSRPKAVVLTHANALWGAKMSAFHEDLRADDVHLVHLPLFHINALCYSTLASLFVGGTAVVVPRFSTSRFWEVSQRNGCTWASMIPFAMRALMTRPVPEHSFRIWGAGASSPEIERHFGVRTLAWYGMTETVTHVVVDEVQSPSRPGAMGRPSPEYEVAVLRDDGTPVEPGETGHVLARGIPGLSLFAEYLHDPVATRETVDENGWLRTGDTATLHEDGYLSFADRAKDMLKVGGENVAASEIESVIAAVPGVVEVAVVAAPHRMLDQVPIAFVIAAGDEGTTAEAVLEACRSRLSDFKVPREVRVVDELPRSTLNKIAKAELRKTLPTYD